jgi:hypothetical protein
MRQRLAFGLALSFVVAAGVVARARLLTGDAYGDLLPAGAFAGVLAFVAGGVALEARHRSTTRRHD